MGEKLDSNTYGTVYKVRLVGSLGLPHRIEYVGKKYKGNIRIHTGEAKREPMMQIVHRAWVICTTRQEPHWTITPYYNGSSLMQFLQLLPSHHGRFTQYIQVVLRGGNASHTRTLHSEQISKINVFCENVLHIIHALVDGLGCLHDGNWIHTYLHPRNILLDFVGKSRCRVAIIDWGMAIDTYETRKACNILKK